MAHGDARLRDRHAGAHALQSVDDDDVAGREAVLDDAQAVDEPACLDGPVLDDALLVDDEHEALAEIRADRAIVDERRAVAGRAHELHAREQARRELPIAVVEHGARTDRAVVRVDLVVDEVEPSRVRIAFLVDEADVHDAMLGRVRLLHVLEIRLLVDVEVRVDGAVRDERRQHDRRVDQVCRPSRSRATRGRAIGAVTRVNDRSSFAASSAALIDASCAAATVASAATCSNSSCDVALRASSRSARSRYDSRELELRERALALGRQPVDFRLERPRIDLIQEVACRDTPAFREMHGLDVAADARPNLDAFDGFEPAREVGGVVELVDGDFGRRDLRRRRSRWGVTGFADGATHESERQRRVT